MKNEVFLVQQQDQSWSVYCAEWGRLLGNFSQHGYAVEEFMGRGMLFTHPEWVDDYRVCSWTGKVFNEGFCIADGARYTDNADLAANYLRESCGYPATMSNADIIEAAYADDMCYYTEWY